LLHNLGESQRTISILIVRCSEFKVLFGLSGLSKSEPSNGQLDFKNEVNTHEQQINDELQQ